MPHRLIDCQDIRMTAGRTLDQLQLQSTYRTWHPILSHSCTFDSRIFESVSLNLIKNPNINSSLLFRADIISDSEVEGLTDYKCLEGEPSFTDAQLPGFTITRRLVRRMIPRNPQLDKALLQTCLFLRNKAESTVQRHLVIYIPHCTTLEELPWYHPRVHALAYLHLWHGSKTDAINGPSQGQLSLHFDLGPDSVSQLSDRLLRTGQHLLSTLHRHGQGTLQGYEKHVHHDLLVPQSRVQNTYARLKVAHAKRLCENWVEQTEPSKHVFEDLGIAAFLIEIWADLYRPVACGNDSNGGKTHPSQPFPGFVDIGCGNGVLVDILIREGYAGWGFDARKRKTWSTFTPSVRRQLKECILLPEPLLATVPTEQIPKELVSISTMRRRFLHSTMRAVRTCKANVNGNGTATNVNANGNGLLPDPASDRSDPTSPDGLSYHDGVFPEKTFIISNHADELSAWTPLLASLSGSPFLCIPCCSHNLSGARFRAPSVFNGQTADRAAPDYFAPQISHTKNVPLVTVHSDNEIYYTDPDPDHELVSVSIPTSIPTSVPMSTPDTIASTNPKPLHAAESGDLKTLAPQNRRKQASAYSSLCDWVAHLSGRAGYVVEREMLRMPSTRNVGIVGRTWQTWATGDEGARRRRVEEILQDEKLDGQAWIARARGLHDGAGAH